MRILAIESTQLKGNEHQIMWVSLSDKNTPCTNLIITETVEFREYVLKELISAQMQQEHCRTTSTKIQTMIENGILPSDFRIKETRHDATRLDIILDRIKNKKIYINNIDLHKNILSIAYSDTDYLKYNYNEEAVVEFARLYNRIISHEFFYFEDKEIGCSFKFED